MIIQMITLIALSRLKAMEAKQSNLNERNNNESTNLLQKNTNPATPQSWRDLCVSNKRLCSEPLHLSSSAPIACNPRIHAKRDAEYLRFGVVIPARVGL